MSAGSEATSSSRFSLVSAFPHPNQVQNLGAVTIQALNQRISTMSESRLAEIVLFELPLSPGLDADGSGLFELLEQAQPGRRFLQYSDRSRLLLIDQRVLELWRNRYGARYLNQDYTYSSAHLPFADFLSAALGDRKVKIERQNFVGLVGMARDGQNPHLLQSLKRRLKDGFKFGLYGYTRERKQEKDAFLIAGALAIAEVDAHFLDELWRFWEQLPGKGHTVQAILEIFDAHPLTIRFLDNDVCRLLMKRSVSSPDVTFKLENRRAYIPDGLKAGDLAIVRHYNCSSLDTRLHRRLMPYMPYVQSIRICLGSKSLSLN
jgi:hypothetical protein